MSSPTWCLGTPIGKGCAEELRRAAAQLSDFSFLLDTSLREVLPGIYHQEESWAHLQVPLDELQQVTKTRGAWVSLLGLLPEMNGRRWMDGWNSSHIR